MVKHNNVLPNQHFHKNWENRVKTWFNQAARKKNRRSARKIKASTVAPRPVAGPLRPVVRCQTVKYNTKVRAGRGFTLDEIKKAGLTKAEARGVGIAVDHRRRNRSENSLQANVQRLKQYRSNLIVFPRKMKKPKTGDSNPNSLAKASQLKGEVMPISAGAFREKARKVTKEEQETSVYRVLRDARAEKRHKGMKEKRAAEKKVKAELEAAGKK